MCTEFVTKHRLFPKERTEFYKLLLTDNNRYFSPVMWSEYYIGKSSQSICFMNQGKEDRGSESVCSVAIHLFENKDDVIAYKDFATQIHPGIQKAYQFVIGVFFCPQNSFYCCGLTRVRPDVFLPTSCYKEATLIRSEPII